MGWALLHFKGSQLELWVAESPILAYNNRHETGI
jgi:hypothetical protein